MRARTTSRRYSALRDTAYPYVRAAMNDFGHDHTDESIEEMLLSAFPNADPEVVESFFRSLSKAGQALAPIAKAAAPIAKKALPGAIQGAVQGGTIAGPWGAVAGALGGGALAAVRQPAKPTATAAVAPAIAPSPPVGATAPVGAAPANATPAALPSNTTAQSQAATAQLLALLSRPETLRALQALALGLEGRKTLRVGSQPVPPSAIANAISELAAEAARTPSAREDEAYYIGEAGVPRCDMASPTDQAARLMADLAEADEAHTKRTAQLRAALHHRLFPRRPAPEYVQ